MRDDPKTLVSTAWLAEHLNDPDLRVLDGSWYLPAMGRDPKAEFAAAHIPGARFFDIDEFSDQGSTLPHMAPAPAYFADRVRHLGIADGQQIVVYDGAGLFSAARVWWLFRLMGKTDVAVLDGGLPKWRAEGRPLDDRASDAPAPAMTVRLRPDLVCDMAGVAAASRLGDHEILDARAAPRFRGEAPEPRPGLRSGHIPGSKNVPFTDLLTPAGTMKSPDALRRVFADAGVDLTRPAITTCGSGVTASVISLALERIGHPDHALYDGSWAEWGMQGDRKVATGE